jgi:hypothetical protein
VSDLVNVVPADQLVSPGGTMPVVEIDLDDLKSKFNVFDFLQTKIKVHKFLVNSMRLSGSFQHISN